MNANRLAELWQRHKRILLELFVLSNLAFLVLDIYLAHSINRFRQPAEWIPFWFSIGATVLLAVGLVARSRHPAVQHWVGIAVGYAAILVGIWGLVLHLDSQFFERWTIESLVYTAPFMAPLSYAGIGFLLLVNRTVDAQSAEWGIWVTFFALGGFVGNFILSLADHAQNGFFLISEWIPVVSSAFAVSFLGLALRDRRRGFLLVCLAVLGVQAIVGVVGFYLHISAGLHGESSSLFENFIYGAPILAPMLFADLFALGALGIADGLLRDDATAVDPQVA